MTTGVLPPEGSTGSGTTGSGTSGASTAVSAPGSQGTTSDVSAVNSNQSGTNNGLLPDTGGPLSSLTLLVAGLLCLFAGALLIYGRRRMPSSDAE